MAEAQPEVLARHWTEAGETETAIVAWTKAGKAAQSRNAFTRIAALRSLLFDPILIRPVPLNRQSESDPTPVPHPKLSRVRHSRGQRDGYAYEQSVDWRKI